MAQLHEKVDIVTAGGGWTAAILAQRILPGTRHTMVSLEQGSARWTYPEFAHNHDSLRYSARYAMMVDLNREAWTWRPNPSKPSLPMRQYGSFHPGAGVGGAAVHWSAQLWRFLPTDFRYRSHVIDRYGKDKLPEGVQVQDWGITYDELEPYYDAFEYDIGASGETGNLNGHILPGGNPFEGPRARPYPNPALTTNAYADLFGEAARSLGNHPFPQPAGILSRAWTDPFGHDRSACLYCGFCTRFGCEVDAKASPITTHLPVALETGRYEIRTGCKVVGIETADNGMATGLRYVDGRGDEHVQPAEVVVLSAFTFTNNKLLLVSRSKKHPDGVGNDRGRVGKNYTYQQYNSPVKGLWQGRRFNMYMGNTCTINIVYDYYGDVFDHSDRLHRRIADLLPALRARAGHVRRRDVRAPHGPSMGPAVEGPATRFVGRHRDAEPGGRVVAVRGPVPRPRPEVQGLVGLAAAAAELRLARQRLQALRVHEDEVVRDHAGDEPDADGRARPEAVQHPRLPEHAPDRRLHHGHRPVEVGDEQLRAGLGHAERVRDRRRAVSAEPRCEPDGHGCRAGVPHR